MDPAQTHPQSKEPQPVVVKEKANKDGLVEFALKEAQRVGSIVEQYEEFEMNGILNVRVINTLVLCKSRFYARVVMLQLPHQEYSASKFLVFLPEKHFKFDKRERVGDQIVFYKYLLMEEYTITLMKWARSKKPQYGDKEIMGRLRQECPVFCELVKFKYVDYKYELIKYPDATIPHYDILSVADSCNLPKGDVEVLSEVYIDEPINYQEFSGSGENANQVEEAVFVSKRTKFRFREFNFAVERSIVFWVKKTASLLTKSLSLIKMTSTKDIVSDEGIKLEALILENGSDRIYLKSSQPTVKNSLMAIFRLSMEQTREAFNNVPESNLPLLFKKKVFENVPQQWSSLKAGTILFVKQPSLPAKPPVHFAVYLGNNRVLHTNFDISVGDQVEEGSVFKIEGIEVFIDIKKTTLVNALIPVFLPFDFETIDKEAKIKRKEKLDHKAMNLDHENMPFEFIYGKRFSYEKNQTMNAAWLGELANSVKLPS